MSEKIKFWHTNKERPEEGARILMQTQEYPTPKLFLCNFDCVYFRNFEICYDDGEDDCIPVELIIKWAYVKDLEALK